MIEFPSTSYPGEEFATRAALLARRAPVPVGRSFLDSVAGGGAHPGGGPAGHAETGWVTLVVGSGCPAVTDEYTAAHLAGVIARLTQVRDDDSQIAVPGFNGTRRAFAAEFLRGIVDDRSAPRLSQVLAAPPHGVEDDLLDRGLVVTRLVTTLYYAVLHADGGPYRATNVVDVDPSRPRTRQLVRRYLDPLRDELDALISGIPAPSIFHQLAERLAAPRFSLTATDLRAATDWCWLRSLPPDVLPLAWTDLITELREPGDDIPSRNLSLVSPGFVDRLRNATEHAWRLLASDERPSCAALIDAAARLLIAQNDHRVERSRQKLHRPPAAVAFTTTVSMEMELALVAAGCDRIVIVLPATVIAAASGRARLCWLGAEIDCRSESGEICDAPRALRSPRSWHVISNLRSLDQLRTPHGSDARLGGVPVVVHLSGCPYVDLPAADGALGTTLADAVAVRPESAADLELAHAIVTDEFVALQASATEAFVYPSTTGEAKHTRTIGLPRSLVASESPHFSRYWALLGIPFSDVATRLRLAPRLPRRPTESARADEGAEGTVGVAVNRALGPSERRLLKWSGFDVVLAGVEDFIVDLAGHAETLEGLSA